jgi:uncharacterized protein (TIGR02271 family)
VYYDTYGTSGYEAAQATRSESASGKQTAQTSQTAQTESQVVIPLYQETVNVGKKEVDAGTVHLRKVVHTETVNQPVELRRETVSIEREPASTASTAAVQPQGQPFQEQEFTIQLRREEPLVQTAVIESGRVVAQKQAQTEQSNIQRSLRREDIAIDKGNAQDVSISEAVGGGTSPGSQSQGAGSYAATAGTITDLSKLTQTTDASSLSGKTVQLSNIKVQEMVNPNLICIGPDSEQSRVYAYLHHPVENLKVGDKVNLTGVVKEPSKVTSITASLGNQASQRLSSQPFFVDAQSVKVSNE